MTRYDDAQMMLGDDFHRIEMSEYGDIGMSLDRFDEACLNFGTCVVLMMQDAEFRVSAFLVEVILSVLII